MTHKQISWFHITDTPHNIGNITNYKHATSKVKVFLFRRQINPLTLGVFLPEDMGRSPDT
jgi:hypothetical protein